MLVSSAQEDWQLAGMVCKTLWNFAGGLVDPRVTAAAAFGDAESEDLAAILTGFLGVCWLQMVAWLRAADQDRVLEDCSEEQARSVRALRRAPSCAAASGRESSSQSRRCCWAASMRTARTWSRCSRVDAAGIWNFSAARANGGRGQ